METLFARKLATFGIAALSTFFSTQHPGEKVKGVPDHRQLADLISKLSVLANMDNET